MLFWVLPKRSIPKPDPQGKDIIQQESLGIDMLQELMNSNYTRYHIELIYRSCGGWLVLTQLLGCRSAKTQQGWEVTVPLAILNLAGLNLHPRSCPPPPI